jgi:predicted SprT family Zn-dependent metalloprotease
MQQAIRKESPNRQYVTLSAAFDFFNRRLFAGGLPPALITMQRHAGARGYYSAKRFEGRGGHGRETDEIALNPGTFKDRTDAEILSTLVHEMVHHWQAHFGNPGRGRYHNEQWAKRMEELGLMPSETGEPGGRRVGQRVTHYVVAGGRFDKACRELLAGGARVEWQSRENEAASAARARSNSSKTKYTCPGCAVNAWAKPDVRLLCGDCGEELEASN